MYCWKRRAFRAFTLIELLVVIAIIALLVSILLPSLRKAKFLAYDSICLSNLHHVGLAIQMYVNDHDGMFPYTAGNCPTEPWTDWRFRVGSVVGGSDPSDPVNARNWRNGYLDWQRGNYEDGAWKCPTALAQITPQWRSEGNFDNHYGMNDHLIGEMKSGAPYTVTCKNIGDFSGSLVLVADSHIGWYPNANGGKGGYYFWGSLQLNPYWYAYDAWPLQLQSRDGVPNPFSGHTGHTAAVARIDGAAALESELTWQDFTTR